MYPYSLITFIKMEATYHYIPVLIILIQYFRIKKGSILALVLVFSYGQYHNG